MEPQVPLRSKPDASQGSVITGTEEEIHPTKPPSKLKPRKPRRRQNRKKRGLERCVEDSVESPMDKLAEKDAETIKMDDKKDQVDGNLSNSGGVDSQTASPTNAPPSNPSPSLLCPTNSAAKTPTIDNSSFVSPADHKSALDKIAKLSQDLDRRIQEAELANKMCRDLSAWTYNERTRLMRDMEAAKSKAVLTMQESVHKQRTALTADARRFLALEINRARGEVGLPPLSKEEMSRRLHEAQAGHHDYGVVREGEATDKRCDRDRDRPKAAAGAACSLGDQVDELILHEAGKRPGEQ